MASKQDLINAYLSVVGVGPTTNPTKLAEITEGRASNSKYAWCGDAATWALESVGCRDKQALNRVSINGKWIPGQNLVMLQNWHAAHNAKISKSEWRQKAQPGDYVILFRPDGNHIGLIQQVDPLVTIDGNGQMGQVSITKRTQEAIDRVLEVLDTTLILQAIGIGYVSPQLPAAPSAPDAPGDLVQPILGANGDQIEQMELRRLRALTKDM